VVLTPQRVRITDPVLDLFAQLDRVPASRRHSQEFKDRSYRLADMLGLTDEWWHMNSVLDTCVEPCHPPHCASFTDWHTCRALRLELLAALKARS